MNSRNDLSAVGHLQQMLAKQGIFSPPLDIVIVSQTRVHLEGFQRL